jgi:F-type H+-transporting ATPase subunit gamma
MLPLEITGEQVGIRSAYPLYEFEPSETEVLDALLPRYVAARIRSFMLEAAASEVVSRQRSMHAAVDNSKELIDKYTRLANAARQSDITNEINEIVSGANGLAAGNR